MALARARARSQEAAGAAGSLGDVREVMINAVGNDRPGIVAALTDAMFQIGGNLTDCRAALLRGSFAMVLAVSVPDDVSTERLTGLLDPVGASLGLVIAVADAAPAPTGPRPDRAMVSVYGADHPGILNAVAQALSGKSVNVVDLSSRVVGTPPIYVVGIEVELPPGVDAGGLEMMLRPIATEQAVELSVTSADDEVL